MSIIVFSQNVSMNLVSGCKNPHTSTLTALIFDTWAGPSPILYASYDNANKNPATRLDVVKSLQKLYESEEYISNLRHFTERFQTRFVEMATSDADRSVRAATIVLLDSIRQRD